MPNGPSSSAYTNASGTMIINPGDTMGASGDPMDTVIVAENGNEQSSDYLAALRAASSDPYRWASLPLNTVLESRPTPFN